MPLHRKPAFESLEPRTLFAVVTVNAAQVVRAVNPHVLGVNLAWWDTQLPTARTRQMVQDAGLNFFRFPGGSSSDEFHFSDPPSYNGKGTAATFANFIASVGGQGVVTLNYGTGSPQEAAAWLAYLNADPSNATVIGPGQHWNAASNTWVRKDWKTAGYWASLRAAAPLAVDDGLNFLRIRRPAPFALHYFEVGNEEYGSWETDRHGQGGDTGLPHDPATYAKFAKQFADVAAQIDPSISIGIDSGSVGTDNDWTARVLRAGQSLGFVPGFISDHLYMQGPGSESDSFLLNQTVTGTGQSATDPRNWRNRAANYRALLNRNLGTAAAAKVELLATEYNSVYSNPGKQTTSLVNGLFAADSIGSLLQTEYNGANFWDLRNGWDAGNNNSASLYGWRQAGDYGMLGSGPGPLPSTGTYVPYPTYFAHQLASKVVLGGESVVSASADNTLLSAYAVRQADGGLDLLVINKSPTADLTQQVQLQNYRPSAAARVWQYGKAEDTAQSRTADGSASPTSTDATLALNASSFSYTFPSYSMTVIELAPAAASVAGRYTFYNHSALDGDDAAATSADDAAIAADKRALVAGGAASFTNVTSYGRGINGVMVDVAGLPLERTPAAGDFVLETLSGSTWSPLGATPSVSVRRNAGTSGADRVTLVLPDGAVKNTWLRVTVKPTVNTGLKQADVFTFGNLVGETGAAPTLAVNARDLADTRAHFGRTTAAALNRFDFDRDGAVDADDVVLERLNLHRGLPQPAAPLAAARYSAAPVTLVARAPTRRSAWEQLASAPS
jgi:alpha-L-arabinofuranosidase